MAEQEQPAARTTIPGNGKNLAERLAAIGGKPVLAMDDRPEVPIATIIRDWLEGANEHYRRAALDLTASYARKLLEIEEQRHEYMRRMLEALTK